jgi:hypothetical protein
MIWRAFAPRPEFFAPDAFDRASNSNFANEHPFAAGGAGNSPPDKVSTLVGIGRESTIDKNTVLISARHSLQR